MAITPIWSDPVWSAAKAICFPSGETFGSWSVAPLFGRVGDAPAGEGTLWISPPDWDTIAGGPQEQAGLVPVASGPAGVPPVIGTVKIWLPLSYATSVPSGDTAGLLPVA